MHKSHIVLSHILLQCNCMLINSINHVSQFDIGRLMSHLTVHFSSFVKALCEVLPEAKDLITISGNEIPIMGDVDESGLVEVRSTNSLSLSFFVSHSLSLSHTHTHTLTHSLSRICSDRRPLYH